MAAEVLNGTVNVGDKIAYATRTGSSIDMITATVLEVLVKPHKWRDETVNKLRVQPVSESNWRGPVDLSAAKPRTISELHRVVKLNG